MKAFKKLYNPNYIYVFTFIIPFLVYSFEWSTIYPELSSDLLIFYLWSFVLYLICGVLSNKFYPFYYNRIQLFSYNFFFIVLILSLHLLEILYFRTIPLLGIINGSFIYGDEFGIPILHTLLVSFNSFYCVYIFHQYISKKSKTLLFQFLVLLLPYVLLLYRSNLIGIFISCFFIFLLTTKITYKVIFSSLTIIFLIFYGFGYLGNLRSGDGDSEFIPRNSGVTEEFLQNNIPNEYYWTYLYVASPVANLQNNINYTKDDEGNIGDLIVNECFPEFIIKISPFAGQDDKNFYQINEFLNVGTIYVYAFTFLRWKGMIFMLIYFLLFINFYYGILYKSKQYRIVGMGLLFNLIVFANFHNTIAYSASSLQLLYPIIFSFFYSRSEITIEMSN